MFMRFFGDFCAIYSEQCVLCNIMRCSCDFWRFWRCLSSYPYIIDELPLRLHHKRRPVAIVECLPWSTLSTACWSDR
ncbi:hypothetical protein CsatB_025518 [Cannabis sativa]